MQDPSRKQDLTFTVNINDQAAIVWCVLLLACVLFPFWVVCLCYLPACHAELLFARMAAVVFGARYSHAATTRSDA